MLFSTAKEHAKIVRDCYKSEVVDHLIKFPTESDVKFNYRKDWRVSKFTNYTSAGINAMSGLILKSEASVDDNDLEIIPYTISNIITDIACDGVGYLVVDAPKEFDGHYNEGSTITYVGIGRVDQAPTYDDNGHLNTFKFSGTEIYLDENEKSKERKYRKTLTSDGGKKEIEIGGKWSLDSEWVYEFKECPVVELDITNSGKHPFIDVAQNNLWLYNLESDERNIIHFICSPYVQIFGEITSDKPADQTTKSPAQVFIGADRARRFDDKSKHGIIITEAQGSGVKHATNKIASASAILTRMSVSVLSTTNYKTATEARDAQSKSLGLLPYTTIEIERAFNKAIYFMGLFRGKEYSGGVRMNKDFSISELNTASVDLIKYLYESGAITKKTMVEYTQENNVLRKDLNPDDEIKKAEEEQIEFNPEI